MQNIWTDFKKYSNEMIQNYKLRKAFQKKVLEVKNKNLNKEPLTHLAITQNGRSTKVYLNGNRLKNKELTISTWIQDSVASRLAKELENK